MGSVYSQPEKFGLELFGEIEWQGGYEFDKAAVWVRPDDGQLFYGEHSGCSCVSPFEGLGIPDLDRVTAFQVGDLLKAADAQKGPGSGRDSRMGDIAALMERLMAR